MTAGQRPIFVSDIFAHTELQAAPVFDASNERTRPNLKVQDGCDNRCSFCVIPYVRGQSRSLRLSEIIREVESLVNAGYREVVISGINLGRWGRDLGAGGGSIRPPRFEDLVRAILSETALQKLRISSVEPMDWSDELIQLMATSSRIAKHAHVPLAIWQRRRASPDASQIPPLALSREDRKNPRSDANRRYRSRCDDRLSRRNRSRIRSYPPPDRRAAVHLPACLHLLRPPRHTGRHHGQSGSSSGRPRTQPHPARSRCKKETRIHAHICRQTC